MKARCMSVSYLLLATFLECDAKYNSFFIKQITAGFFKFSSNLFCLPLTCMIFALNAACIGLILSGVAHITSFLMNLSTTGFNKLVFNLLYGSLLIKFLKMSFFMLSTFCFLASDGPAYYFNLSIKL